MLNSELRLQLDAVAGGRDREAARRREGVTEAAGNLQEAGFIRYSRGHITVIDHAGLERRTSECYAVVKNEFDRLLPACDS